MIEAAAPAGYNKDIKKLRGESHVYQSGFSGGKGLLFRT